MSVVVAKMTAVNGYKQSPDFFFFLYCRYLGEEVPLRFITPEKKGFFNRMFGQ
jgi:septum formation inhibitor-activating ATPase MinD